MGNDRTYFRRRAAQEHAAAANANGKARDAHRNLAERYDELARSAAADAQDLAPAE